MGAKVAWRIGGRIGKGRNPRLALDRRREYVLSLLHSLHVPLNSSHLYYRHRLSLTPLSACFRVKMTSPTSTTLILLLLCAPAFSFSIGLYHIRTPTPFWRRDRSVTPEGFYNPNDSGGRELTVSFTLLRGCDGLFELMSTHERWRPTLAVLGNP